MKAIYFLRQGLITAVFFAPASFTYASEGDRAVKFNAKLKELIHQSSENKSEDQRFKATVDDFLKQVSDPKFSTPAGYALKDEKSATALLRAFEHYPGSSQAALQAGALFANCDLKQDQPDGRDMTRLWVPPQMPVFDAFRMLLASGEALGLGAGYKKRVADSVRRFVHHESAGPTSLIWVGFDSC